MTDERLKELVRAAVPLAADDGPRRDLWPQVATRFDQSARWSYLDLGLAAAALVIFPEWFWLLAYHL
jgi:hypothetical protein